jgi:hypothetical protein
MSNDDTGVLPYKQRLIEEQKQLQERIDKLSTFLDNDNWFNVVTVESFRLLRIQLQAMNTYNEILIIRLAM